MHRMPMVHAETNGAYQGGFFIVIIIIVVVAINKFWNSGKAKISRGQVFRTHFVWFLEVHHGGFLMFLAVPVGPWWLVVVVLLGF